MRVLVLHHSKYGNGKSVAEAIAAGLKKAGHSIDIANVKEIDTDGLGKYDAFVIGSPTHVGGPTFKIGGMIKKIGKTCSGKPFVVFATRLSPAASTVKALESKAEKAGLRKLRKGKAFRVMDMKGPLEDGAIEDARAFGKTIGECLG